MAVGQVFLPASRPPPQRFACSASLGCYLHSYAFRCPPFLLSRSAAFCPEALVVESLQRMADWCLRYARDEDRRGGLPPIPSSNSIASELCSRRASGLLRGTQPKAS